MVYVTKVWVRWFFKCFPQLISNHFNLAYNPGKYLKSIKLNSNVIWKIDLQRHEKEDSQLKIL